MIYEIIKAKQPETIVIEDITDFWREVI